MADQIESSEFAPGHLHAVVEAFLDGNSGRSGAAACARRPEARDHFVDLVIIREAVGAMDRVTWSAAGDRSHGARSRASGWPPPPRRARQPHRRFAAGQRTIVRPPPGVEAVVQPDSAPSARPTRSSF
jgi:hypothetical protein